MSTPYDTARRQETTEDGDLLITVTAEAKDATEARDFARIIDEQRRPSWDGKWTGAGGKLRTTYCYVVDGAEVAIERSNDAWASSLGTPEWAQ